MKRLILFFAISTAILIGCNEAGKENAENKPLEKSQELNSTRTEKPTNVNLLFTCAHE
ncbi:MAG: hypothetical protein ACK46Y_05065 [Fluviicola sp.]|jgi:hypothetical protein